MNVDLTFCSGGRGIPLPALRFPRGKEEAAKGSHGTMEHTLRSSFLNLINGIINFFVILSLSAAGFYAVYALWDNHRVYQAAENVQADMIKLKPGIAEGGGASFEDLLAVNPDVCAWVTLDHTNIDYPVLQGSTNLTYINQDVYGSFALAGSIYLDSRNNNDFSDKYSLLYGHHMENGSMFGDLDLYKEKAFFEENITGMLLTQNGAHELEIFACMLAEAGDPNIFEPAGRQTEAGGILNYIEQNAMYLHEDTLDRLKADDRAGILAFSTCSSEFTDARTIVFAWIKAETVQTEN